MSGFHADNSRIRVLETVGSTDETVFDTDEDMPHIVGTANVSNVTVDFSNLTQTTSYSYTDNCSSYDCTGYVWTWDYVLEYDFWGNGYYTLERVEELGDVCCETDMYITDIDAREYTSTQTIATLPVDEDGNTIPVDFVVVQATGSRTRAGKDPRFSQALPTTVPSKTFSFQGSVLLESSGKANGDSFLRRIMSVVVVSNKLKVHTQESVGALRRGAYNSTFPYANSSRSTFKFNFKIFFGRFKS